MAYRKKTSYRSSPAKKTYKKRSSSSSSRRRSAPRAQTIRLELHHVMAQPQTVPVLGEGGGLQMPTSKAKSPKL